MTSLSTVLEGEARLRRRSALVRCSLRITAITLGCFGGGEKGGDLRDGFSLGGLLFL